MNFSTQTHWLYQQRRYLWWFWGQSYRGGEGMRLASATSSGLGSGAGEDWQSSSLEDMSSLQRRFLWSHERESSGDYMKRMARSRYMRYAGYAVDVRSAGVTEGASEPKTKLDGSWLKDTDGRGGNYQSLRARWCSQSQVYGAYHVGCDILLGGNAKTARRKPGLPFLYGISPLDLPLWGVDRLGRMLYAVVRELATGNAIPPWKEGGGSVATAPRYVYRLWTPTETILVDDAGRELAWIDQEGKQVSGPQKNPFNRVPIETVFFRRDDEYPCEPVGQSWIEDPALVNLWHYNLLSLRDTVVTDTAFPFLAWPRPDGETQVTPEQEVDIGTKVAVPFFGSQKPEWVQPSPDAVNTCTALITEAVRSIRELAGLTIDSEGSQEAHSAEALALMRANLDASFGEHARSMEDAEERICRMACEIANVSPDGVEVDYPEDYGQQEAGTRMADIVVAMDAGLRNVPSAYAMLLKSGVRAILPRAKSEDLRKVDAEIDTEAAAAKKREEERAKKDAELAKKMAEAAQAQKDAPKMPPAAAVAKPTTEEPDAPAPPPPEPSRAAA